MKKPEKILVVIAGPTAVGKTDLSIRLAEALHAEIVSADSRQVFKELNIGTAKPTEQELASIRHYFVNHLSITQSYDAAQFSEDALAILSQAFEQRDFMILCGGSGLYIKAVCEGFDDIPDVPDEIREKLSTQYTSHGISWLQQQMMELDPEYYSQIDPQNPHRLIRALEVKIGTGESISNYHRRAKREHNFRIIKIGLELPREVLNERIDKRMDDMIHAGLFEEAAALFPFREHNALQTVGYQEIFDFMEGKYDRDEAVRLLKRNSRRYAKRQMTWFKRDPAIRWFSPAEFDEILRYVRLSGDGV